MENQPTETFQSHNGFASTKPTMTQNPNSRYNNRLTFNIIVMFLFYILSVTLCLSSVSTCVCVVFNPIGTLDTIAHYLFYALVSSLLLASLSIVLIGVYFDNKSLPELWKNKEIRDENLMLVQEGHIRDSATQKLERSTLTQEALYKDLAPLSHEAEGERARHAHLIEAPATRIYDLIHADEFTTNPTADDEGVFIPRLPPVLGSKTGLEDHIKKYFLKNEKPVEETARSREESTSLPEEMSNVAEVEEHAPKFKATSHIVTASQEKATTGVSTTRESRKIENWISQANLANIDKVGEDHNKAQDKFEMMAKRGFEGGPLSETQSIDRDSGFQTALRAYMRKGASFEGKQRRRRNSISCVGSREESEFQGMVRKMFLLEKGGGKKRARSAGW